MIKTLIAPIQSWLMAKGQCPGCGRPLAKGYFEKHTGESDRATCTCGRIFIHDKKRDAYRRALFDEI